MFKSLRWLVLIVASIIAVSTAVAASPVSAAGMSVQPSSGSAGTTFVFTATGFNAKEPVSFSIFLPNGVSTGAQTLAADSQGRVQFSVQVPSASPAGKYTAGALGQLSHRQYSTTFTVTAPSGSGGTSSGGINVTPAPAGMSIQPTTGDYTTSFLVTAGGFLAGEGVWVWTIGPGGLAIGPGAIVADSRGAIQAASGVPMIYPVGKYTVYARGQRSGHQYSATFTLNPSSFPNWKGEYFNNRYLSGSPVLIRNDEEINFDWGTDGPGSGLPATDFSVRWTTTENVLNGGDYTINVTADDGVRVWLDGNLILNEWIDESPTDYSVTRYLGTGTHTVQVEYYQHGGGALIQVEVVAD